MQGKRAPSNLNLTWRHVKRPIIYIAFQLYVHEVTRFSFYRRLKGVVYETKTVRPTWLYYSLCWYWSKSFWRAQLSTAAFSCSLLFQSPSSTLAHTMLYKPLSRLYLDSRCSSYQKPKLKIKILWCLCTRIATLWRIYCYRWARNRQKSTKTPTPSWSRLVLGTRTPQILN